MKKLLPDLALMISRPWFRIAACLVLAALFALFSARRPTAQDHTPTPAAAARAAPDVSVVAVKRADLVDTLALAAEFRPFQEVSVHARVSGYVKQMRVDVGSRVRAGDVIAVLEVPELQDELRRAVAGVERAQQEVARARSAYDDAHLRYTRLAEVLQQQPNLVAQQDVDEARMRDAAAKASWDAAQSAVREAVAGRAKLETYVSYARITAPFTGVVTRRYADTGSLVGAGTSSSGQALVQLSQLDPLRLVLPVPESAVTTITVGTPVSVHVQSTGETVTAAVSRRSGDVATTTRTMRVEVDVPNRDLHLAPGMYASAVMPQAHREHVLVLPIEAVPDRRDGAATLLAVDGARHVRERRVSLGLETATQVEVTAGLGEGDLVVLGSRGVLRPGDTVVPKPVTSAARP